MNRISTPELLDRPVFTVSSKENLKKALLLASLGLFTNYTIIINDVVKTLGKNFFNVIEESLDESEWIGGFPVSQERVAPCKYYFDAESGRGIIEAQKEYYFDVEKKNEFYIKCNSLASYISSLREDESEKELFRFFYKWLLKNVRYEDNDERDDYDALKTFETGHGICHAISSIACRVFENLGYPTVFINGKYGPDGAKVNHCWISIKRNGKWRHYDFTHSLKSNYIPCTDDFNRDEPFEKYRSWDKTFFSEEAFEKYEKRIHDVRAQKIVLSPGEKNFCLGNIIIESKEAVLKIKDGSPFLNLDFIYSLWGGGCVYDEKERLLKCFSFDSCNYYLQPDEYFDNRPDEKGYVSLDILRRLPLKVEYNGKAMKISFK